MKINSASAQCHSWCLSLRVLLFTSLALLRLSAAFHIRHSNQPRQQPLQQPCPNHDQQRHFNLPKTPHNSNYNMTQTRLFSSTNDNIEDDIDENSSNSKIFFDIAIISPTNKNDQIPLGRLTFQLTPPSNPAYLPLHTQNLINLASGTRRSVDPKATYIGCPFAYSPAFIQDGSFRYKWGHECDGFGRNAIQVATTRNSGKLSGWDETFSDPERLKDCTHKSFGGVYYGMRYQDVVDTLSKQTDGEAQAVLLTVPINGPKSGTSKFSMVRVSESPREWGERLLLNSAVIGYLDCGADGTLVGDDGSDENEKVKPLDVLRAMAQQKVGIPTIINCGVL